MSVIVGKVENKFWSNSDHKVPNYFPIYKEKLELKDEEPNMSDFMSGTIYLYGDQWNHCKWRDGYYALYIFQVIDEDKKFYCYRLERELWFDVLKARPRVVGDLINSNDDELLLKHLNRTVAVLDNPANVITINFGEIDFEWKNNFIFEEANKEFETPVLSKDSLETFFNAIKDPHIRNWKKINKELYDGRRNPGIFIYSYIRPSTTKNNWKNLLIEKINNFVRSLETDEGKKYKISKVSTATGTKLQGRYCITPKEGGIGISEEEIKLEKIDLRNLEDIIPVAFHNPDIEMDPFVPLNEGIKGGVFEFVDKQSIINYPFLAKIKRKAYLPIGATEDKRPSDKGFGFDNSKFNWNNVRNPQKVNWTYKGLDGYGLLWFVENLNFSIDYNDDLNAEVLAGWGSIAGTFTLSLNVKKWKDLTYHGFTLPWSSSKIPLKHLEGPLFNFGFLIFGLAKDPRDWKLFQYLGDQKINKVPYFSGIKENFIEQTKEKNFWWSDLKPNLASIQPSEEFTKFYLKNYFFTWLLFFPGTGKKPSYGTSYPLLNTDMWGTWVYTNNKYEKYDAVQEDLYDISGKWKEGNPLHPKRSKTDYLNYILRLQKNLNDSLLKSTFDLPDNVNIEKGDYFFTNLDYEIKEYSVDKSNYANLITLINRLNGTEPNIDIADSYKRSIFALEDFVNPEGSEDFLINPNEKLILLCGTFDGNLEVRELETFAANAYLSDDKEQIIKNVDNTKSQDLVCTLLKKASDNLLTDSSSILDDSKIREQIIHAFYKANGYKTKIIGSQAHWNWFNESDFEESNDRQLLFDLKGTDWYCFIAKGKITLISKNFKLFSSFKGKTQTLLHKENKDLNLSPIEKINQKVRFHFLMAPYALNWKTTFSDKDRLTLTFESLSPTPLQTQFEQYFIRLDTGFDQIYYENISIPKKHDEALNIADSVSIENLNREQSKIQYAYQIEQDRFALATKRYEEQIKRAQIDLNHQRYESFTKLGLSLASTGLGLGVAAKIGASKTNVRISKSDRMTFLPPGAGFEDNYGTHITSTGNKISYTGTLKHASNETKRIIKGPSRLVAGVPGAFSSISNLTAAFVMDQAFRFPERQRQIGMERQLGANELAIESLSIDTAFLDRQIQHQLNLNRLFNIYDNPLINERHILEKYLSKDSWHGGKKLANAHLVVFVPSEEQLIELKSFKDEYGVMCNIPDIVTHFYEGMKPDIIRYRNLDDEAIKGLDNQLVRDFLKTRLLAGIKIIPTLPTGVPTIPSIKDYQNQLDNLNNQLRQKNQEIDFLKSDCDTEKERIAQEGRERLENEKNQLQNKLTEVENQLSNINNQLKQKSDELTNLQGEYSNAKKNLEDEIKRHKIDKEEAEQKWDNCKRDYLNEKENKERITKELQDKLNTSKDDLKKLTDLNNELNNENARIKQEITELDKQKQNLEEQKTELQDKLDLFNSQQGEECRLLKKYLAVPEIDLKTRWLSSGLKDLVMKIIEETSWMRKQRLDATLTRQYPILEGIVDKLMKFEEIPYVAKWEEAIASKGWESYKKLLATGDSPKDEDGINTYNFVRQFRKDLLNTGTAQDIKTSLDELNWLVYKAKEELKEPLKTDQDLQYFFKHIYPGDSLGYYEEIFGDPNIALIKKKFIESVTCFDGPAEYPYSNLGILSNFEKTTKLNFDDVDIQEDRKPDIQPVYFTSHSTEDIPTGKKINLSTDRKNITVTIAPLYSSMANAEPAPTFPWMSKRDSKDRYRQRDWNINCSFVYVKMLDSSTKKLSSEQGLYIGVVEKDLIKSIYGVRNYLWKNRKNLQIPKEPIEAMRWWRYWHIRFFIFIDDPNTRQRLTEEVTVAYKFNLLEMFGKKYVVEAATLLGILTTNRLDVAFKHDDKDKWWIKIDKKTVDITAIEKNSPELTEYIFGSGISGGTRFETSFLEFANPISLLNYIWRHVKLGLENLENTFGPYYSYNKNINFEEWLNSIYERNKV